MTERMTDERLEEFEARLQFARDSHPKGRLPIGSDLALFEEACREIHREREELRCLPEILAVLEAAELAIEIGYDRSKMVKVLDALDEAANRAWKESCLVLTGRRKFHD